MGIISVFNHISIDGMFAGPNGEIDWFQTAHDEEWDRYAEQNADISHNTLMFGHTTYQMMHGWWPSPTARSLNPPMAEIMNSSPKIVFSRRLGSAPDEEHWKHVRVLPQIDAEQVRRIKRQEEITILGSGEITQQLARLGLIDEYMLIVVPLVLGGGKPLFGSGERMGMRLVEQHTFRTGVVLLRYRT